MMLMSCFVNIKINIKTKCLPDLYNSVVVDVNVSTIKKYVI